MIYAKIYDSLHKLTKKRGPKGTANVRQDIDIILNIMFSITMT